MERMDNDSQLRPGRDALKRKRGSDNHTGHFGR
jgi:hypothetical protein